MKKTLIYAGSLLLAAAIVAGGVHAKNRNTDISRNILIFNDVYKTLMNNYVDTLDATETMRTAIDAMLGNVDPYTEFYSEEESDKLTSISSGEYAGIGSVIQKQDTVIVLSEPRWDSPAMRGGVRHGDILLMIDDTVIDKDFPIDEASKRLKGKAGTKLRLKVRRPYLPQGTDSIFDLEITRGTITTDAIPYYGFVADGIGYIGVSTFSEKTGKDFQNALAALRKQNGDKDLKGLIVDMRNNGGGLLTAAVDLVSNFVPRGTEVVSMKGRTRSNTSTYKTTRNPSAKSLPLVVLINGNTASSAEIFTGALQDLDRAVVIGERSYGKGLVQTPGSMPYNSSIKVTTGRYYLPSGRLIQAIDYRHRNADGSVERIPDSLTTAYQTKIGREVRDGGGITPDIAIESEEPSLLEYGLVTGQWVYNFATKVANNTATVPDVETWQVTDSLYDQFKKFIDPTKLKYDRPTASAMDYVRRVAKAEGYESDSTVTAAIADLEKLMTRDLDKDLDHHRKAISEQIDIELESRWFSPADMTRRALRYDAATEDAIKVLNDTTLYRHLLSAGTKVGGDPKAKKQDAPDKSGTSDNKNPSNRDGTAQTN